MRPIHSTIVDGHHNGKHWVAHLNCDHRQKHDRRPELSASTACRTCTSAYSFSYEEMQRVERRMTALQRARRTNDTDDA